MIYLLHSANCFCSCLELCHLSEKFKFAIYNPKWLKREFKAHVQTVAHLRLEYSSLKLVHRCFSI